MAKTRAELQAAVDELLAVCRKHGVVLIGGCMREGIYGEIGLHDADSMTFSPQDLNVVQVVPECYKGDPPFVFGIGETIKDR